MANNYQRKQRILHMEQLTKDDLADAKAYLTKHAPDLVEAIMGTEGEK
jgi:hypothetical protein